MGWRVLKSGNDQFQADTLIVKQMMNGLVTVSVSNDTDYAFLRGNNILQLSSLSLCGLNCDENTMINISLITLNEPTFELYIFVTIVMLGFS